MIAARDNEAPFLSAEEYATLLDAALTYFHDERDTRGLHAAKGWMHSAAHTSDLLKFLARNPRLPAAGPSRILSAVLAKNRESAAPFSQGEDERMAPRDRRGIDAGRRGIGRGPRAVLVDRPRDLDPSSTCARVIPR